MVLEFHYDSVLDLLSFGWSLTKLKPLFLLGQVPDETFEFGDFLVTLVNKLFLFKSVFLIVFYVEVGIFKISKVSSDFFMVCIEVFLPILSLVKFLFQ